MKFKTEKRSRVVQHTRDGITHDVTEPYEIRTPVMPADWDQYAIKAAVTVVALLTAVAVVWSTYSIGALLDGGMGYAGAAVFDAAWIVNVLMEYLARFDPAKRSFSKKVGWLLLAATMGSIFWHGLLAGSVALGVVGAAVSLFAKVLWMGIMRFINRDLSQADQQWVKAEISRSNAQLAIAGVRRQVARAENRAALELLAAEQTRTEVSDWMATTAPAVEVSTAPAAVSAGTSTASALTSAPEGDAATLRRRDVTKPGNPLFQAPAIRKDEDGYPADDEFAQVSATDNVHAIRPDVRPAPETTPEPPAAAHADDDRVPEQTPRRPSIASAVRKAVQDGVMDAETIVRSLGERFDRTEDPKFAATVKRYVREAKQEQTDDQAHGLYL
ncbi:hypothetical protein OHB41_51810 [Streptomyces sp. NBC_01571]|uniref:hypothetical protein n=1 Tax=Streptomyces sp. NBC_01571 TaxID=2975883 RepID=UPI002256DBAD|nr:hypothetical protein [Streptomyces sp. NBC_01571]MCX4581447.1 hypothetical protein [Streptomyces sp. NBC_01571]